MARYSGFELPRIRTAGAALAVAVLVGSIINALALRGGVTLMLVPGLVFSGHVWQPLSWLFVERTSMGVIFGVLILWSIGGALESVWGRRRFLRFALGVPFTAGVITLLVALALPEVRSFPFDGGRVMTSAVWVAYGLFIGPRQANFWGLPTTGYVLAMIGAGFVVLGALMEAGPLASLPDLVGLGLTAMLWRFGGPGDWWSRLRGGGRKGGRHLRSVRDPYLN